MLFGVIVFFVASPLYAQTPDSESASLSEEASVIEAPQPEASGLEAAGNPVTDAAVSDQIVESDDIEPSQ